jgi:hypothetical protein
VVLTTILSEFLVVNYVIKTHKGAINSGLLYKLEDDTYRGKQCKLFYPRKGLYNPLVNLIVGKIVKLLETPKAFYYHSLIERYNVEPSVMARVLTLFVKMNR